MLKRKPWTVERKRRAVKLYLSGLTMRKVSAELGSSVRHVHRILNDEGVVRKKSEMYRGAGNPAWNGGTKTVKGYTYLYRPKHPNATKAGYVAEHRLVMEEKLGRLLSRKEVVHHKNTKRKDNRLSNLELYPTNGDHLRDELSGRCPNWTEDGLLRIQKSRARRKR